MKTFIKDNIAKIILHEDVTKETSEELLPFINGVEFFEEVDEIIVSINSQGGSVLAGYSIFSALRNSTKRVTTRIEGIAASIAGVIFLAGDNREMLDYSLFMLHNASGGDEKVLNKINESLEVIFSKDFNNNIRKMMDVETWLNANEMSEKGIVNKVIDINVDITLDPVNKTNDLFELCNTIIKNNDITKMLEDKEKNEVEEVVNETVEATEEVVETVETETEETTEETTEEVVDEATEEISNEVEVETESETEEIENNDELLKEIEALKEANKKLEEELELVNAKKLEDAKMEFLNTSNFKEENYENLVKYDLDILKEMNNSVKVSDKAPSVSIVKNSNEVITRKQFDKMSLEEKKELMNSNKELYKDLILGRRI